MNDTTSETVSAVDLQRGTRKLLNAVMHGRHVKVTRYSAVEAVIVSPDWYDRAVRALFNAEVNGEEV